MYSCAMSTCRLNYDLKSSSINDATVYPTYFNRSSFFVVLNKSDIISDMTVYPMYLNHICMTLSGTNSEVVVYHVTV